MLLKKTPQGMCLHAKGEKLTFGGKPRQVASTLELLAMFLSSVIVQASQHPYYRYHPDKVENQQVWLYLRKKPRHSRPTRTRRIFLEGLLIVGEQRVGVRVDSVVGVVGRWHGERLFLNTGNTSRMRQIGKPSRSLKKRERGKKKFRNRI